MTKLNRNWSNNRRGKVFDILLRSPFSLLQFLLCIAALVLGFRLSRETLLVVSSSRPSHDTVKLIRKAYTDAVSHDEVALGFPYVKDDRRNFTPSVPPGMLSSLEGKSSRVHVGRHEILIRPWPHPDPEQILLAHQLLSRVQDEQRRILGLKARKQLLVITPTYVRTFQALYLTSLIHTLRAVSGPLIWIVVEAGGISNETAALLANSQLSYCHLGIEKIKAVDSEHVQQVEALLRLEGLRFIGEQQLDGIVLFADDSNTYSFDYFDEAQKVVWVGFFSVGLLSPPRSPALFKEIDEGIQQQSSLFKNTSVEQGFDESDAVRALDTDFKGAVRSSVEEGSLAMVALPFQAPVCNSSGQVLGWYLPRQSKNTSSGLGLEWTGFAMNARIFWKDQERPIWIEDWMETLGHNQSLLDSPLAFVKDVSLIEPLGNCGKDVLIWRLRVEARFDSRFPSRWTIGRPLDVSVPSKRTPWPEARLEIPPPPPLRPPAVFGNEQLSIKGKALKVGKGKRKSHPGKHDKNKKVFSQILDKSTVG